MASLPTIIDIGPLPMGGGFRINVIRHVGRRPVSYDQHICWSLEG